MDEISVGAVDFNCLWFLAYQVDKTCQYQLTSNPASRARFTLAPQAALNSSISSIDMALGLILFALKGMEVGP